MAYYNKHYSYPDIRLWDPDTWSGWENEAAPVIHKLEELIRFDEKQNPPIDHFAKRFDEHLDSINWCYYFDDVVEEWKKKGMHFLSSGMMGAHMAPEAVEKQEIYETRVLYVPYIERADDTHQIMNLLEENRSLLEFAAEENILVQFINCAGSFAGGLMEKAIETQGNYRISYDPVLLDISMLYQYGLTLNDVKGLDLSVWKKPYKLGGRIVVDISDKWQLNIAHQYSISQIYRKNIPEWDFDRHFRSLGGKRQAEEMRLEHNYTGPKDPKMESFWQERGLRQEDHYLGNDWYVTLTPECVFERPKDKISLLIIMKEPRTSCPQAMQTAYQFYYDFIEICAQGQFMILYFALETPWDNDKVLPDILQKVFEEYPVDRSRVYLTGQSHNGYYAQEFYRKHPKLIAACASLCDPVGLEYGARADDYGSNAPELVESFRQYDFPLIDINGNLEDSYARADRTPEKIEEDLFYFENRMKAMQIPAFTREEMLGAQTSPDYATRRNGVPSHRTEVRYTMGIEAYISDYQNEDGKWYFRYVSLENTPHMIMPQMAELSWEFMRRFARDPETGAVIELY